MLRDLGRAVQRAGERLAQRVIGVLLVVLFVLIVAELRTVFASVARIGRTARRLSGEFLVQRLDAPI